MTTSAAAFDLNVTSIFPQGIGVDESVSACFLPDNALLLNFGA
ncbi:hypothetical protein [Herbaspirillum sp. NPDC101397]